MTWRFDEKDHKLSQVTLKEFAVFYRNKELLE